MVLIKNEGTEITVPFNIEKYIFYTFFILIDDALQPASIVTLFLARTRLGVQSPSHGLTIYINDCVGKPVESHVLSTTP